MTGASSGIGRELARLLARDGYEVVLVARREALLNEVAAEIGGARVVSLDLRDHDAAVRLKNLVSDVDLLVNNAGFGDSGPFAESDSLRQLEMIDVNVRVVNELSRLYLPGMIQRRHGRILNVASTAAFQSGPYMATYFATKAFVLSFSEALAEELRGTGVSVTALCPGLTQSEFHAVAGVGESRVAFMKMARAESVARAGYEALLAGRVLVVPGVTNRVWVVLVKVLPRLWVRRTLKVVLRRIR